MCIYWMQMQFTVQENEGMKIISLEFSHSPVTLLLLYLVSRHSLNVCSLLLGNMSKRKQKILCGSVPQFCMCLQWKWNINKFTVTVILLFSKVRGLPEVSHNRCLHLFFHFRRDTPSSDKEELTLAFIWADSLTFRGKKTQTNAEIFWASTRQQQKCAGLS